MLRQGVLGPAFYQVLERIENVSWTVRGEGDLWGWVQMAHWARELTAEGSKLFLCYDIAEVNMVIIPLNKEASSEKALKDPK
uniref:Uncharacterized protein n=1 Tax=Parascaris univalens TaxID=6257 RepID=A0A915A1Y6_PARUN